MMYQTVLSLCGLIALVSASNRCVHVRGKLECIARGPAGYAGAQVALYDRDGKASLLHTIDPDDRMGYALRRSHASERAMLQSE